MSLENLTQGKANESKYHKLAELLPNELKEIEELEGCKEDYKDEIDLAFTRRAILSYKSADANYEKWKKQTQGIIDLRLKFAMLMGFDIIKQDKTRKGIAMILQDMINKELQVKIADKSMIGKLKSLTFPKQIKWLDDRYKILKPINIREKITDFLNEHEKFKQSKTMRETLVNNQVVFNKNGHRIC
ncbi:hypothetical protein C6P45_005057 [Maudiozyma exigua]|uniref:Uncharacterized protein n=1 Tax=Maudiozyma exigua TaxID=34358 RepID=A0A9P7BDE4_MAUEX|nr:hypothetical protein C6P45_005057 [Kazachstania exigua]